MLFYQVGPECPMTISPFSDDNVLSANTTASFKVPIYIPGLHTITGTEYQSNFCVSLTYLVTAMDPRMTVAVSETKQVLIELESYPDMLICAPVVRPEAVYACSIVMFGNLGLTTVEYSNRNLTVVDIPG